jgi:hypothetical protein
MIVPGAKKGDEIMAGKKFMVNWSAGLKLRTKPEPTDATYTGVKVPDGTVVEAIGEPSQYDDRFTFQQARTPDGTIGWLTCRDGDTVYLVAVEVEIPTPESPPATDKLWVNWADGLRMRAEPEPSLESFTGTIVPYGTTVTALGAPSEHPDGYTFQKVRLDDGTVGWLTMSDGDTVYLERVDASQEPVKLAQANPPDGLWVKMHESPGGAVKWWVGGAVPLQTIDPVSAGRKIGQAGQWIEVESPAFKRGYITAQYLKRFAPGKRKPKARSGDSPYIYGVHDRYDREVLKSAGTTGWVLFTHGIGTDYQGAGGDLRTYYEWTDDGFGVLARLNHGYGSSGTIPEPAQYNDFARTCAAFVKRSIDPQRSKGGCHYWIIANEMNNPREYPGNHDGQGGSPITPENYADCFNRVYKAIKQVYGDLPGLDPDDGAVVMGAVDPYNALAGCNGDWFVRALRHIDALDGFALHAYTHGTDPGLITDRKLFGGEHNPPQRFPDKLLSWQYYNFYAYRTFMDLIPVKWRDVPVFLTETDQVQTEWANVNSGWVKNMYAEIDRWNSDPNRQKVYCALLFRWEAFDGWQIKDKGGVLDDLKSAARKKYRWVV